MRDARSDRAPQHRPSQTPKQPLSERLAAAGLSPGPSGLATVNRSVTLDEDLDRELSAAFPRGDRSRFLNAAARDALVRLRVAERLARFEAERGPIPEGIRAEVAALPRPS